MIAAFHQIHQCHEWHWCSRYQQSSMLFHLMDVSLCYTILCDLWSH